MAWRAWVPACTDAWRTGAAAFMIVSEVWAGQSHAGGSGQAVCKTVGLAYVGSNHGMDRDAVVRSAIRAWRDGLINLTRSRSD